MTDIIIPDINCDYDLNVHKLNKKNVVITGAANGLGKALTLELLHKGSNVVAADINYERLQVLEKEANNVNLNIHFVDVTNYQSQLALFKFARKIFNSIDLVYANAGVNNSPDFTSDKPIEHEPDLSVLDINLKGVFYTAHLAVNSFREDANNNNNNNANDKTIVLTGSFTSFLSTPGFPSPYAASKHGVFSLMRSLATQGEIEGFRCNLVCPWFAKTEMVIPSVRLLLTGIGLSDIDDITKAFVLSATNSEITGNAFLIDENGLFIIPSQLIEGQAVLAFRKRFIWVLKVQHALRSKKIQYNFSKNLAFTLSFVGVALYVISFLKKDLVNNYFT